VTSSTFTEDLTLKNVPAAHYAATIGVPAPCAVESCGALEDLAAQVKAAHYVADQLEQRLCPVLRPMPPAPAEACAAPATITTLRDLIAGANHANNRLSGILARIDL
jgi:hypothetical protein